MMPTGLAEARRIVVFRGLMLGDVLCAVPAWRALRAACPQATITWVGLPWAHDLAHRLAKAGVIDDFIPFPGAPGIPEQPPDAAAWPAFLATVRARRFDWALQMHGSGLVSNPVVAQFGAAQMACFVPRRRARFPADVLVPWPRSGHEIERLLTLTDALDCPRQGRHLVFPIDDADRHALQALWPAEAPPLATGEVAVVHVGAQLPSRRWSPQRFAQVADRLAAAGNTVVLTGSAGEAALVAEVGHAMSHPAIDLAGRTSLWTLGALIERARLVVCNDTGLSHIAAALHTPSVVVSCGAEVPRWAPLDHALHPVLWHDLPCRPCAHVHCPLDHDCAHAITTEAVWHEVQMTLSSASLRRVS